MSTAMIKSIIYVALMALMAIGSEAYSGCTTEGNGIIDAFDNDCDNDGIIDAFDNDRW